MLDMLLVNVPAIQAKKDHDRRLSFDNSLNFGILAIATHLEAIGYTCHIVDLQTVEIEYAQAIKEFVSEFDPKIVGFSCISGFSYPLCKTLVQSASSWDAKPLIVVGGKDHVGLIPQTVLQEMPHADVVACGEGEKISELLIKYVKGKWPLDGIPNIWYRYGNTLKYTSYDNMSLKHFPVGQLKLYPEYKRFAPCIEVSRGCPYKCSFCSNRSASVRKAQVEEVFDQVVQIADLYGHDDLKLYFEAPLFVMSMRELEFLQKKRRETGLQFEWRTETRVSYLTNKHLEAAAKSGLKVIDLGFESASIEMLKKMNKAPDPKKYIKRTEDLLACAQDNDVIIKLNLLFFIGETPDTIEETMAFLDKNSRLIRSISAYPFLLYPSDNIDNYADMSKMISQAGGSIIANEWSADSHLSQVNPSRHFTYEIVKRLGNLLGKAYQSVESFFAQKTYGYFAPGTTYEQFLIEVGRVGPDIFPFYTKSSERDDAIRSISEILRDARGN